MLWFRTNLQANTLSMTVQNYLNLTFEQSSEIRTDCQVKMYAL